MSAWGGGVLCILAKAIVKVQVGHQEKFLLRKSGNVLEQAAQGGGGITFPGDVQETFRCYTEGDGLVVEYWW